MSTARRLILRRLRAGSCLAIVACIVAAVGCSRPASDDAGAEQISGAVITAEPNPVRVADSLGSTTLSWSTGGDTQGHVRVSVNGGPEQLFATGPEGTGTAEWIQSGQRYEFRLYTEGGTLLTFVEVTTTSP